MNDFQSEAKQRMEKTLEALSHDLGKVRTGRASISMLDDIKVESYGSLMPINQVATLNVPEPRLIVIQPWDAQVIPKIEKAIQNSDLSLSCSNDGQVVRIPVPALTEDRRKDLVKIVKKYGEDARVGVRHTRRDILEKVKKAEKDKELSEDESKKLADAIQKITDQYVDQVAAVIDRKEKDVMEV